MPTKAPKYSIVIPIFNEEETLPELYKQISSLLKDLDGETEVLLINDGSRDNSYEIMCRYSDEDKRFKLIDLSRNFGHQTAITAGMDLARGDAVIIMDADLQDPPEVIHDMIAKWRDGYEIVYAVRKKRLGESWFKLVTASLFYRVLRRMTNVEIHVDTGDFRLVDRRALNAFNTMRERNRFVRGMFSWIGFKHTAVEYERAARFAGETKYPLSKMLKLATDAIISFSDAPLKLSLSVGFLVAMSSFLYGIAMIILKIAGVYSVSGWTSLVVVLSFLGGIQLSLMGMMGLYVARIHDEVKNRPLYLIGELRGFDNQPSSLDKTASVIDPGPKEKNL